MGIGPSEPIPTLYMDKCQSEHNPERQVVMHTCKDDVYVSWRKVGNRWYSSDGRISTRHPLMPRVQVSAND